MGPSQGRYPRCLGTPHRVSDHLRCDVVNTVLYACVLPLHLPLRVTSDHAWCVTGSTHVHVLEVLSTMDPWVYLGGHHGGSASYPTQCI